jgi:hypothetical protein
LVRTVIDGAQRTGSGTGRFAGWQRWTGDPSNWQAYVVSVGSSTLVIYGSASDAELADLVASLQPSVVPVAPES